MDEVMKQDSPEERAAGSISGQGSLRRVRSFRCQRQLLWLWASWRKPVSLGPAGFL